MGDVNPTPTQTSSPSRTVTKHISLCESLSVRSLAMVFPESSWNIQELDGESTRQERLGFGPCIGLLSIDMTKTMTPSSLGRKGQEVGVRN